MSAPLIKITVSDNISFDLVYIEGGNFIMGDEKSEKKSEKPLHQVKISSFYMSKYQITQHIWEWIIGENPSYYKGEKRPVESVSWDEVQDFIKKLNKSTGKGFRLPTEAKWEYAARGGRYSQGYTYSGSDKLKQVGWHSENSNRETHEVGLLLANELGLYDMSGNVYEWCEDDWHDNYNGAPVDGSAWIGSPARGVARVVRGGYYFGDAVDCRSSYRRRLTPDDRLGNIGFRLILPLQSVG